MRILFGIIFLTVLAFALINASSVTAGSSDPIVDIGALKQIEKILCEVQGFYPSSSRVKAETGRLARLLEAAPANQRAAALRKAAPETKWGSLERFVVYYVCAWYGIDYTVNRDYMLHATFWKEWGIGPRTFSRNGEEVPYSFAFEGIYLLFRLYEHNHDFRLLHDILTTECDAAAETTRVGCIVDALLDHPRGVLHVAEISGKGWNSVYNLIHSKPDSVENPVSSYEDASDIQKRFRWYVQRVASDPKDPLAPLARNILQPAKKSR